MSRRDQIRMSATESQAFLEEERTVVCATLGPRGWPHLMPLWYVLRPTGPDGPDPQQLWAWTYAASQKVRNLERDPRATLQVETGELYQELRGAMLECEVRIHRDLETVSALGREILARNAVARGEPAVELPPEAAALVQQQAAKRVGLQFLELRRSTWDHRKLAGVY
jgi:nitroimidazol reductase NimA-like FMN-containing flavoprotein (pyridoxamine 5'-phosphate oxidase superfamily)